jgi:peptide/nickel transport system permease protein
MAPVLTKWDYAAINVSNVRERPSITHIFGTDYIGRDLFSRMLYGGRITLKIALVSTVLAAVTGSIIGLLIGYFGGGADFFASHFLDMIASIPIFLLVIVFEAVLGWGRGYFMYAMAIAAVPQFARLVRISVMNTMGCEYVEAARALGANGFKIIRRHVIKNITPTLVIRLATGVTEALLICTLMGYVGVGISPPTPEWGNIALIGKSYSRSTPFMMFIPCAVIIVCAISLNLFSDGLRDALDPRD